MTETAPVLNAPRHRTTLSSGLLRSDRFELRFLPEFGCHWTRLRLSVKGEWVDFLKPVPDGDALLDHPTGHGSYILAPWSNRIPDGRMRFGARSYDLRTNFPDGSAIHGDVRTRPWDVIDSSDSSFEAALETRDFDDFNYPFDLRFRHRLSLDGERLTVEMAVENADAGPAPVGLGYHPFVLRRLTWRDDDVIISVPAERVYPADRCIPSGPAEGVRGAADLRRLEHLGAPDLDHCYTGLTDNQFRIIYVGTRVEVRFEVDESFTHAVIYAPNAPDGSPLPFVAVEPVTHANNGFNLHADGWPDTGVRILEPGEVWRTRWSLSVGDL